MGVGHTDGEWVERIWSLLSVHIGRLQRCTDTFRWDSIGNFFENIAATQISKFPSTVLSRAVRAVEGIFIISPPNFV